MNLTADATNPPTLDGYASANCIDVTTYVAKSPSAHAKNTAIVVFFFLNNL